jgi:hypothetical protein
VTTNDSTQHRALSDPPSALSDHSGSVIRATQGGLLSFHPSGNRE